MTAPRPIDGAFSQEVADLAHDLHALVPRVEKVLARADNPSDIRDDLLACIYDLKRARNSFDAFLSRAACMVLF